MKFYLHLLVVLCVFASCSGGPNGDPVPEPPVLPPVILPDTLSTGWAAAVAPSKEVYGDIFFAENNTGYLVGEATVYKSTNGGLTWAKLFSTNSGFSHMAAGNANNICFVDPVSLRIFNSQNGGNSIDSSIRIASGDQGFYDAFFSSANTCYVSGNTTIRKSTDGGVNFTTVYNFTNNQTLFSSLFFIDDMNGFILRDRAIYKTTNGGADWTKIRDVNLTRPQAIQFLNASTGFYSDDYTLWKTTDGGTSWTKIYEIAAGVGTAFNDMAFIDGNTGYFVAGNLVVKTTDGGTHWEPVIRAGNRIVEIHFTDPAHGWACGFDGKVFVYRP